MQALRAEYGADSPQYQAAGQLLVAVLGHAQAQLLTAFKDRCVLPSPQVAQLIMIMAREEVLIRGVCLATAGLDC